MMIIMKSNATPQEVEHVIEKIKGVGLSVHLSQGVEATIIGAIGETHSLPTDQFEVLDGVETVQRITQPYKLASRQFHPEDSVFPLDGFSVGGEELAVIAGPCSVESRSQIIETAHTMHGATVVPDHQVAGAPAVRMDEFALRRVLDQIADEGHGLRCLPADDGADVRRQIKRPATGRGMLADQALQDRRHGLALMRKVVGEAELGARVNL